MVPPVAPDTYGVTCLPSKGTVFANGGVPRCEGTALRSGGGRRLFPDPAVLKAQRKQQQQQVLLLAAPTFYASLTSASVFGDGGMALPTEDTSDCQYKQSLCHQDHHHHHQQQQQQQVPQRHKQQPPQPLPGKPDGVVGSADTQLQDVSRTDILDGVSMVLEHFVSKSSLLPKPVATAFDAPLLPSYGIRSRLEYLMQGGLCSKGCFIIALIYGERLLQRYDDFAITAINVDRLMLVCLMVASKILDDFYCRNVYYAIAGGLSNSELNALELKLCFMLNFDLNVTPEEFSQYKNALVRKPLHEPRATQAVWIETAMPPWANESHAQEPAPAWSTVAPSREVEPLSQQTFAAPQFASASSSFSTYQQTMGPDPPQQPAAGTWLNHPMPAPASTVNFVSQQQQQQFVAPFEHQGAHATARTVLPKGHSLFGQAGMDVSVATPPPQGTPVSLIAPLQWSSVDPTAAAQAAVVERGRQQQQQQFARPSTALQPQAYGYHHHHQQQQQYAHSPARFLAQPPQFYHTPQRKPQQQQAYHQQHQVLPTQPQQGCIGFADSLPAVAPVYPGHAASHVMPAVVPQHAAPLACQQRQPPCPSGSMPCHVSVHVDPLAASNAWLGVAPAHPEQTHSVWAA